MAVEDLKDAEKYQKSNSFFKIMKLTTFSVAGFAVGVPLGFISGSVIIGGCTGALIGGLSVLL